MKKLEWAFLVMMMIFLSAMSFGMGGLFNVLMFPCPDCKLTCPPNPDCKLSYSCPSCPACVCLGDSDVPQFVKVVENMADEHTYELGGYDCDEYAKESERRMDDMGYDVYYCEARALWCDGGSGLGKKYECRHALNKVCVYYDSTTGEFHTPQEMEDLYDGVYCR